MEFLCLLRIFSNQNHYFYNNYTNFLKNNIGTNKYPTDPTDPRNWGSQEDDSKWFIETDLSKKYYQELALTSKKIDEKYI